jgi:holo-[acyl-carrier protein] synthase
LSFRAVGPGRRDEYDHQMALSVGLDLVCTDSVQAAIREHGDRYLQRIYTDGELRDCAGDPTRLAARFAVKEATMKALGRDDEPIAWTSIAVDSDHAGRPSVQLTGAAAELARQRGITDLAVSLTHEGPLAAAVVLAEVKP